MTHSHQMSSLSMITLATTSRLQYTFDPLLHGTEQAVPEPRLDHLYVRSSLGRAFRLLTLRLCSRPQTKDYWERANMRRMRRWCLLQGILLSIMGKSLLAFQAATI